jgi:hypothetical protein
LYRKRLVWTLNGPSCINWRKLKNTPIHLVDIWTLLCQLNVLFYAKLLSLDTKK